MKPSYDRSAAAAGQSPEDAAAAWLARQDAGFSAADEAAFERWLLADPRHAAAWEEAEGTWQAFDEAQRTGAAPAMVQELARRAHRRRWRKSLAVAASLTAAAAAVVLMFTRPDPSRGVLTRVEHRTLDDGSTVELPRDSAIEVHYQSDRRLVKLVRGVALFTVARNSARPFIVSTGQVSVQAVGTAFAVQTGERAVDVIVTEGKVAVERTAGAPTAGQTTAPAANAVLVASGNRLVMPVSAVAGAVEQLEALSSEELLHRLEWREPRIELAGTRLKDAAELFNRENALKLQVIDSNLGELRLSGTFRAQDPEGFTRLLAANYGVEVSRQGERLELRHR